MSKELKELLTKIVLTVVIVFILLNFVIGIHINHSNSMAPAMKDGGLVMTYRLGEILADEVVVYKVNGEVKFGRIVGMPGDVIYMDEEGKYTINGNIPQELIYYETYPGTGISYPYEVAEGTYFIMNDLRTDTRDSRIYGSIKKDDIEGVVYLELRRRGF